MNKPFLQIKRQDIFSRGSKQQALYDILVNLVYLHLNKKRLIFSLNFIYKNHIRFLELLLMKLVASTKLFTIWYKANLIYFHINKIQSTTREKFFQRIAMCKNLINEVNRNVISLENFVFSDESTFYLNSFVNKHNYRYWSNSLGILENPNMQGNQSLQE